MLVNAEYRIKFAFQWIFLLSMKSLLRIKFMKGRNAWYPIVFIIVNCIYILW